jgi:hypothetical protein
MNAEKLEILEQFLSDYRAVNAAYEAARDVLGVAVDGPLFNPVFRAMDSYLQMTAAAVGDECGSLEWFVHDNDMGRGNLTAGTRDDMREIKTAEELLWLIGFTNGKD